MNMHSKEPPPSCGTDLCGGHRFERDRNGTEFTLHLAHGERIDDLKIRLPPPRGYVFREKQHVTSVNLVAQ
jgi:hypothetical protein